MDRVRNEEVRKRAGIERELASRADQRVLRRFGRVEIMDEYRMAFMRIFARHCVLSDCFPVLGWLSPGEGWVAVT